MTRTPLASSATSLKEGRTDKNALMKGSRRNGDDQRERLARDVLSRQHGEARTMATSLRPGVSQPLVSVPEPPVVSSLTPEQMYSNFEEWIKMCTDNKVNATNSWNFALIDYFHEMTFIREGDSINFQKASCTLDGCVKIYTSRVDSVASETGKLLSGLADSARDTPEGAEDDELRADGNERRGRRKGNRAESTLLKDFSSLAVKKFDLDFTVDPLFKKTSADFDEGGARGLLLNHLCIDRDCKISFDASDARSGQDFDASPVAEAGDDTGQVPNPNEEHAENTAKATITDDTAEANTQEVTEQIDEETEDNDMETEENGVARDENDNADKGKEEDEQEDQVQEPEAETVDMMDVDNEDTEQPKSAEEEEEKEKDASKEQSPMYSKELMIKDTLIEISRLKAKLPPLEDFNKLVICPTLQGFAYFSDHDVNIPNLDTDADEISNPAPGMDADPDEDNMGFPDFDCDVDDEPMLGGADMDPFTADDEEQGEDGEGAEDEEGRDAETDGFQEEDYIMAMINNEDKDLFSYFDTALVKNWAGPEHWKLRRPVTKAKEAQDEDDGAEKTKRKPKPVFQIDFLNGEDVDEDEIFATDKKTKITLPAVKESAVGKTTHLLPDDMQFSSKQLLKFFLKPTFNTNTRKKQNEVTVKPEAPDPSTDQADLDAQFWADQGDDPMDQEDAEPKDEPAAEQGALAGDDDTGFFQDTFYDNDDEAEVSALYGDPLITNHRLKRTKPLYVNYARTAKRVDVKKLKDNLWKALTTSNGEDDATRADEEVQGERRFTDIVHDLKRMYSPKVMKDISVPFCFICLLHLANEKNLTIASPRKHDGEDDDDFVLGEGDWMQDEARLNELTVTQNA